MMSWAMMSWPGSLGRALSLCPSRLIEREIAADPAEHHQVDLLRHAFETVGLDSVYAETMAVNEASRGVVRKLGMTHERTYHQSWDEPLPGTEHGEVVYEITREAWFAGLAG